MSSNYLFGTNNFTIECFIYPSINNTFIFSTTSLLTNNIYVAINSTNNIIFYYTLSTITSNTILTLNNWYNICITRNGTAITLYINGIIDTIATIFQTASIESSSITSAFLIFGINPSSSQSYLNYKGYLKEFRITLGVARYLTNYSIQSTPFANTNLGIKLTVKDNYDIYWYYVTLLLHFDGITTFINDSSNYKMVASSTNYPSSSSGSYMFGNSSLYFPASGSAYLVYPSSSNFALKNSNFTIEFWFQAQAQAQVQVPIRIIGNINWSISITSNNQIAFIISNNNTLSSQIYTGISVIAQGTWYNVAVVRNNNNILLFINGNLETSGIFTYQIDDGSNFPLYLGTNGSLNSSGITGYFYSGYIDEMRFTNGIARYTTNYSVATSQFPSIAPTQLLTLPTIEEIFTNTLTPVNNFPKLATPIAYYPSSPMTANTTSVSGTTYGTGIYYISASNTSGSTFAYNAFDNTSSTQWLSGTSYTTTSSAYSTTVSGTTRSGEWLQIQLPTPINLKYYSIQSSSTVGTTQSPASFVIAGSNDNSSWYLVDIRTGLTWNNNGILQTFTVSNNILAYTYFRLIGISLVTSTASLALAIGEFKLYGYSG